MVILKAGSEHTISPTDVPGGEEVEEDGFPLAEVLAVYAGSWEPGLRNLVCLFIWHKLTRKFSFLWS